MSKKIKNSLELKTAVTIAVALLAAVLCFLLITSAGEYAVEKIYLSRDVTTERMETFKKDFIDYVNPNGETCESISKVQAWLKDKPGLSVYAYDIRTGQLAFECDGHIYTTYDEGEATKSISENSEYLKIKYKDTECNIELSDNTYREFFNIVDISAIVISCLLAFIIMYLAFRDMLKRILKLSRQVKAVTYGDTEREVKIKGADELSELGENINSMRMSLIEYYEKEQKAIKANNDLLTSISHDIRTPLTSVIGYSEMMADERTTDPAEMKKYAEICKEKAYRLKELTDTMFRYFFVYGKEDTDLRMEKFDAQQLFVQVLGEHSIELMQEGFTVENPSVIQNPYRILIDVDMFNRVLENMFTNFKRYADKSHPITISGYTEDNEIVLEFENTVMAGARKAESTKIGLRTCSRIMSQMNGKFEVRTDGKIFNQRISIPITK